MAALELMWMGWENVAVLLVAHMGLARLSRWPKLKEENLLQGLNQTLNKIMATTQSRFLVSRVLSSIPIRFLQKLVIKHESTTALNNDFERYAKSTPGMYEKIKRGVEASHSECEEMYFVPDHIEA